MFPFNAYTKSERIQDNQAENRVSCIISDRMASYAAKDPIKESAIVNKKSVMDSGKPFCEQYAVGC